MSSVPTMPVREIRIGSRRSRLARIQAQAVANRIIECAGSVTVTFQSMHTEGDLQGRPLATFGGKGLFTRELDQAVLDGNLDIAAHSLKDLPCQPPPQGLTLAAHMPREDPRDALIAQQNKIEDLPQRARIGGASVRRTAQALYIRPDLRPVLIRGNLLTRLDRHESGAADAMILAACGLQRLGCLDRASALLPVATIPPAPGQGIIAAVTRTDAPDWLAAIMAMIDDRRARLASAVERAFSLHLGGSCNVPLAAHCDLNDAGEANVIGELLSEDGQSRNRTEWRGAAPTCEAEAMALGTRLAAKVRARMT